MASSFLNSDSEFFSKLPYVDSREPIESTFDYSKLLSDIAVSLNDVINCRLEEQKRFHELEKQQLENKIENLTETVRQLQIQLSNGLTNISNQVLQLSFSQVQPNYYQPQPQFVQQPVPQYQPQTVVQPQPIVKQEVEPVNTVSKPIEKVSTPISSAEQKDTVKEASVSVDPNKVTTRTRPKRPKVQIGGN